jgi:hypothetical protein
VQINAPRIVVLGCDNDRSGDTIRFSTIVNEGKMTLQKSASKRGLKTLVPDSANRSARDRFFDNASRRSPLGPVIKGCVDINEDADGRGLFVTKTSISLSLVDDVPSPILCISRSTSTNKRDCLVDIIPLGIEKYRCPATSTKTVDFDLSSSCTI